jgi:hypothetical protein
MGRFSLFRINFCYATDSGALGFFQNFHRPV